MRYPLENTKTHVSSPFGWRVHPKTKQRKMHNGVDYAAAEGTPIYSIADGTVIESKVSEHPTGGFGEYVKIRHANGDESLYAHMVKGSRLVKKGDKVAEGQELGEAGDTGYTTGAHLHLEVHVRGVPVNPLVYIQNGMKEHKPKPIIRRPEKPAAPKSKPAAKPKKETKK